MDERKQEGNKQRTWTERNEMKIEGSKEGNKRINAQIKEQEPQQETKKEETPQNAESSKKYLNPKPLNA